VTLFEFVSVMASIVLGLSLAIFIEGVARVARYSKRVSPFLPHLLWAASLFITHFFVWWTVWDYRDIEWNFPRFFALAATPLLLLFLASLVLPGRLDDPVVDLEAYFLQVRRWFTSAYALLFFLFIVDGPLFYASEPLWIGYRVPQLLGLSGALLALATARPLAQHLAAWMVFLTTASTGVFRFLPGAFS
jgi:hypothetical protein